VAVVVEGGEEGGAAVGPRELAWEGGGRCVADVVGIYAEGEGRCAGFAVHDDWGRWCWRGLLKDTSRRGRLLTERFV